MKHTIENEQDPDGAADHQSLSNPPFFGLFSKETLNLHWDRYHSSHTGKVSDKVSYEEATENGYWKFGAIDLGSASMRFQERDLLVNVPVLYDLGFKTRRQPGSSSQRVWDAHQRYPSTDAQLTVKLPFFDNPAQFHIADDGKLMLRLSKGTCIETVGSGYDSALLLKELTKRNGVRLPDTSPPRGTLRGELAGQFSDAGSAVMYTAAESSMADGAKAHPNASEPVPFAIYGGHRENGKNRTISPADSLQALRLCSRCPNGVYPNLMSGRAAPLRQNRVCFPIF